MWRGSRLPRSACPWFGTCATGSAGIPLPETVRIGSWLLFPAWEGASRSPRARLPVPPRHILHGGGTSAAEWFGSAVASFGLCFVALVVTFPGDDSAGRARMLFGLGAACTVAYAMSPFTGSVQDVFGAMRYLLPGVAFGASACGGAPRRWLPWRRAPPWW